MRPICSFAGIVMVLVANAAVAATERATYTFNDNLSALQATAPALVASNPLGLNGFESATLYGQERRVYRWSGNAFPSEAQAGLTLDTTNLIPADNYSLSMVFEFTEAADQWRRIVDVQDRTSDSGLYVNPTNLLTVYPEGAASTTAWTNDAFHHVVLTQASPSTINVYLDGALELTVDSTVMQIANSSNAMHFFLDNIEGSGLNEYANGRVALIRLYEGVLSDSEVSQLAADPFQALPVPEPETYAMMLAGLGWIGFAAYRRRIRH